jgi:transcription elongation factor Elf1
VNERGRETPAWGSYIVCPQCEAMDAAVCGYPDALRADGDAAVATCGGCETRLRVALRTKLHRVSASGYECRWEYRTTPA